MATASTNGTRKPAGGTGAASHRHTVIEREVSWQAHTIEANTVHKTLQRLWDEIGDQRRAGSGRARVTGDAALMRTRTINLIAVADTGRDAARIRRAVASLQEFFPSRTVILVRRTGASERDGLSVSVAVEERPKSDKQTPVRFETITVSAGTGREQLLASVASPILVSELPDFVWFPSSEFADSPLLNELLDITDRLIVDTSLVRDPSRSLRYLVDLELGAGAAGPHLSDVAWTRLTPWRQMIAQFFDQATTLPCLEAIEDVTITYAAPNEEGRSGLTAGLLLAGWLCTRLGWRAPGEELVRTRDGWKLTLRAGARGKSREVILTLKPTTDPAAGISLGGVTLTAGGNAPGIVSILRSSPESVVTKSDVGAATVERTVYLRNLDDARLLSLELRVFGSDPIYYEALGFAANLWPEGTDIG